MQNAHSDNQAANKTCKREFAFREMPEKENICDPSGRREDSR